MEWEILVLQTGREELGLGVDWGPFFEFFLSFLFAGSFGVCLRRSFTKLRNIAGRI